MTKFDSLTTPVILVAGFSQAARRRVIREALGRNALGRDALRRIEAPQIKSEPTQIFSDFGQRTGLRPDSHPIAWLDHQDTVARDQAERQPNITFVACICCAGSLVFTTYLARTLREGPWGGLVVSLGARAEPAGMVSLLSTAPWKEHLGPIRLFSVMDSTGLALCTQQEHPLHELACQQRHAAEQVLGPGELLPANLFVGKDAPGG